MIHGNKMTEMKKKDKECLKDWPANPEEILQGSTDTVLNNLKIHIASLISFLLVYGTLGRIINKRVLYVMIYMPIIMALVLVKPNAIGLDRIEINLITNLILLDKPTPSMNNKF